MFPDLETNRRPKRRRFLIPLVITVIAAAAWWIGTLAQDELSVAAYLDEARAISDAQAPRAEAFRELLIDTSALQVERAGFTATIDQIRGSVDNDIATLAALEVPEEAFVADVFLGLALERWSAGLMDFQQAALSLPDGADLTARADLSDALVDLQVADAMYVQFQVEAATVANDLGITTSPFVDVEFVEDSFSTPEGASQLIQGILDNPGMAAEQQLAIVSVEFQPAPAGDQTPEGREQIPATDAVTVTVVVRNDGTDVESGLEVRVKLSTTADNVIQQADSASVGELAASGGSTAVEFGGIAVDDGIGYRLDVELARAGGGTIDTDTTEFVVSPPSG
jgi:hypothetical protein